MKKKQLLAIIRILSIRIIVMERAERSDRHYYRERLSDSMKEYSEQYPDGPDPSEIIEWK